MTPIGMIATAIARLQGLIITNWDVVGPYFKNSGKPLVLILRLAGELLKKFLHGRRWGW